MQLIIMLTGMSVCIMLKLDNNREIIKVLNGKRRTECQHRCQASLITPSHVGVQ